MCCVQVQYKDKATSFRPEVISALVLSMIKTELASIYNLGSVPPEVVITVPAYFTILQRRATGAARRRVAGLELLRVVNEPTAGAIAYALQKSVKTKRYFLVYDFGGGTFDCTALFRQIVNGITRMKVVSTSGNHVLGEEDIDEQIVNLFSSKQLKS